jgi:hypothetical protein
MFGRTAFLSLALTGVAAAGQVLPLGPGTACTLTSQPEVRRTVGVRGQHVLSCASPTGTIVRAYLTRRGQVACIERLQVGSDGGLMPTGRPCGGRTAVNAQNAAEPINLSGDWSVDVSFASCTVSIVQDGDDLSLTGTCPGFGTLGGTGKISFTERAFTTEGSASGSIPDQYCPGATVHMTGHVSSDGQSADGSLTCGPYSLSFYSRRTD